MCVGVCVAGGDLENRERGMFKQGVGVGVGVGGGIKLNTSRLRLFVGLCVLW